jgi:probable HAF family extracellular repeat protein
MVVGASEMPNRHWHAFVYDGKRMTDLGAIIGRGDSFATGINNAGHVVGTVDAGYMLQRLSFVWRDNQMLLHPAGKGLYLTNAINDSEQVIGATYDHGLRAATMISSTLPFHDLGGTKLITLMAIAITAAAAAVIYRKRYMGLLFDGYSA